MLYSAFNFFKIILFFFKDSGLWTIEQAKKIREFHENSENYHKLVKKDEKYESIIIGILTDEENFNDLCIDLFNRYEQLTIDSISKSLKVFLEKLKIVLSPPM